MTARQTLNFKLQAIYLLIHFWFQDPTASQLCKCVILCSFTVGTVNKELRNEADAVFWEDRDTDLFI